MKLTIVAKYIVLIFVLSFGFFSYLSDLPIALWDESRLAINAYEMLESGDLLQHNSMETRLVEY